jgi:hypothetical protein
VIEETIGGRIVRFERDPQTRLWWWSTAVAEGLPQLEGSDIDTLAQVRQAAADAIAAAAR